MSIASGFHPDPPTGKITTTSGDTDIYLKNDVEGGVASAQTVLFTLHDAIQIPSHRLLIVADMLRRHHEALTKELP